MPNRLSISDLLDPEKMKALDEQFRSPTPEEIEESKKRLKKKGLHIRPREGFVE